MSVTGRFSSILGLGTPLGSIYDHLENTEKLTQFSLNATFVSEEGADSLMWLAFREKLKTFAEKNGYRL